MSGNTGTYRAFIRTQAWLCLAIIVAMAWSTGVCAQLNEWECRGDPVVQHNVTLDVELVEESQSGALTETPFDSGTTGYGYCICPEAGNYYSLFSGAADRSLTRGSESGWYQLNEYIEVQIYVEISGAGMRRVPFFGVTNNTLSACSPENGRVPTETGKVGKLIFRLTKNFVGELNFSGPISNLFWQINKRNPVINESYPFATINANIRVAEISSCNFREGDTFTVDLGDIDKATLVSGGPPKSGYIAPTIDLSLDCVNFHEAGTASYMFQGISGTEGDIVLTDLRGVGIGLRDGNDNPVGLGAENAIAVPVVSSAASFLLKPYPTKLAGQAVQSGQFTAQVIVTVSLQ